jgi:hypothetical protein
MRREPLDLCVTDDADATEPLGLDRELVQGEPVNNSGEPGRRDVVRPACRG